MTLRCRLGLHQWGKWRRHSLITKYITSDWNDRRTAERDYETTVTVQSRECERCGLTRRRKL